jgi:hypothetical protein
MFERVWTSLARVPPANPRPGLKYALCPILGSDFKPISTSFASAPVFSHKSAISPMKVILAARNAFNACLVISADLLCIHTIGMLNGLKSFSASVSGFPSKVPMIIRVAEKKDFIALPKRRFSGCTKTLEE